MTMGSAQSGPPVSSTDTAQTLFRGPGELRACARDFDWAATTLGPVSGWSLSLRTVVRMMMASRNPMFLWWGPDLVQLYNDAYRPSFGEEGRHPSALGMRGEECWTDIWHIIGPQIAGVMTTGESVWFEDEYIPILRNGRLEDVWWTYSYSPVFDDDGAIGGTLVVCQETTKRMLDEREHRQLVEEAARAEQRELENAERLRAIFEGTYEYTGLLSRDGIVLDCNPASLEFAGSSRDDVIGQPFPDTPWFIHTDGAPARVRQSIARALTGEFVRYEASLRRPSGETRTFDFSLYPVRDASGEVVSLVPEARDITDRVRAEAALRESDARYRALFESIDAGFCVIEMLYDEHGAPVDYRFLETNAAFLAQSGLVDAVGRCVRELVPGLESHWFETYDRVARTGEPLRFENGSNEMGRWFDVFAFRIGRPSEHHVAILFTDVSAQRHAARERERLLSALELERSRLAEVFRRAPSFAVAFRGPEQRYEFVNEAYYQLVGHRDILGKPLLEALPEIEDQGFRDLLENVRQTGEPWVGRETPVLLQRTPGAPLETRYLDMVFQALAEADGTRSGVLAHGSDVTEQVLARREVERLLSESEQARADAEQARREAESARLQAETARAEAESANRAKSEFLAVMSHELRTPLNAIGGYASLIELGIRGPVTGEQQRDLARIKQSQRHLLGLINQVLNYTRVESGTVHYDLADVPVQESLAAAEALIMPQLHAAGLSYTVRDCNPSLRVRADSEKVQQILLNVITNAIKFTKPGGEVRVGCVARGEWAVVSIADTGVGIAPDKLVSVFEPFVQVQTGYTRNNDGVGLGLAISRDLARGMGGDLAAESTPGVGSTFMLTLPLVPPIVSPVQ